MVIRRDSVLDAGLRWPVGRHAPRHRARWGVVALLAALAWPDLLAAHDGEHVSIHDTVAGVLQRLRATQSEDALLALGPEQLLAALTPEERHSLGAAHIRFRVDRPVTAWIVHDRDLGPQPFWLRERGFRRTELELSAHGEHFDVWRRDFDAGAIGLGVNSLSGGGNHYFVLLSPRDGAEPPVVSELYPGELRVGEFAPGARPYVDREERADAVPAAISGMTLIRTEWSANDDAKLLNWFRRTDHPATLEPDQIVVTWSADPRTTQTIQWRTSVGIRQGFVRFEKKDAAAEAARIGSYRVRARTTTLETPYLVNDPRVHRHTATLRGLEPGTTYRYVVGDRARTFESAPAEFTTAPAGEASFSFVYMGDAQNGLDRWGVLIRRAIERRPDAAFYIMAGDLVDRGNERDDWDSFFFHSRDVYDRRQLMPAIGNHEVQGGSPELFVRLFELPRNGPRGIDPERVYSVRYSNALFVVLDSNLSPELQAPWLEAQLRDSTATWKFVVFHHPVYSSRPERDNTELRDVWAPLFDRYGVDMVLQGHDHAYLRTRPIRHGEVRESARDGTIYVISVAGTKMYEQDERPYTAFGMTGVSTYQVLDIEIDRDRLVYRAHDTEGRLRDEITIEKRRPPEPDGRPARPTDD